MKEIKFLALGGLNEEGKNCYVLEIDNSIFILNLGTMRPNLQNYGVDLIIPDISYLNDKIKQIEGIFITNGIEENIGALVYFVKKFPNIPIYCNKYAEIAIKYLFYKSKIKKYNLKTISYAGIKIKQFIIKPFLINFSYPDSVGYAFTKNQEQVVFLDGFGLWKNKSIFLDEQSSLRKSLQNNKTKLLLCGSKNASEKGFIADYNLEYLELFKKLLLRKGRKIVIISINRINEIINMIKIANEGNHKIIINHFFIKTMIKYLINTKKLNVSKDLFLDPDQIQKIDNEIIFITENEYNLYYWMNSISLNKDEFLKLKNNDNVFIAMSPIPGSEVLYYKIIDQFYRQKIHPIVINKSLSKSYFAAEKDLEFAISSLKPEIIVPVNGHFQDFGEIVSIGKNVNILPKQIKFLDNGDQIQINNKKTIVKQVKNVLNQVFIDGNGVGDISNMIIYERARMGNNGVLFLSFIYSIKTRKIVAPITYVFEGIVDDFNQQSKIKERVNKFLQELLSEKIDNNTKLMKLKIRIKKKTSSIIKKVVNKEAEVVVVIINKD